MNCEMHALFFILYLPDGLRSTTLGKLKQITVTSLINSVFVVLDSFLTVCELQNPMTSQ